MRIVLMRIVLLLILPLLLCCGDSLYRTLPRNLSWTSIDLNGDGISENYITPIRGQACKDCYIYTAVGLLEVQYQIDHMMNFSIDLSEQNIHNCLRIPCSSSGDESNVLDFIVKYGSIEEYYSKTGEWRRCENCYGQIPTTMGVLKVSQIPFYKASSWMDIISPAVPYKDRRSILVYALQYGPVAIQTAWGYSNDGDIKYCVDGEANLHSTIIVGYINHGEAFLVKNSHNEGRLIKLAFDGAEKCKFAQSAKQITPGSTYIEWGGGESFCYSGLDGDDDTIPDSHDNCPSKYNSDQKNTDGDLFGDICDPCINNYANNCQQ